MKIQRLKLPAFRNLREFEINFTNDNNESSPIQSKQFFNSYAVLGQNGTGKSNFLEALVTIFRDLDLNQPAALDYELDYSIRGHQISIQAQSGKQPKVKINGKKTFAKRISKEAKEYLPSNIFVYYSGKNERLEKLFQAHQIRSIDRMEISADEFLPAHLLNHFTGTSSQEEELNRIRKSEEKKRQSLGEDLIRRLFYCRGAHAQLILLACFLSNDMPIKQLLSDLNIIDFDSALFILKQPHRLKTNLKEEDILEGDNRFWYAKGNVISELLDKLWKFAVAPIEHTETKLIDFRGREEQQKQLYLFLPSKVSLEELGQEVGAPERFFRYAEGAYIGDLLEEVRITVQHRDSQDNIKFEQLSEGELQLLTVLGLMRMTREDHCLFLLDEPDTHLNPIWKLRYFEEIEKIATHNSNEALAGDSQVIITTHDPLMIGNLRREQVRILQRGKQISVVKIPIEHPQGMGVSGLLKSEMFGLPSTLDRQTLEKLEKRNTLLAKKAQDGLTESEDQELQQLKAHLEDLGFSYEYRDPLYQLFIEKMYQARSLPISELLTPSELQEQEDLAQQIVGELVKRERGNDLSKLAEELHIKLKGHS